MGDSHERLVILPAQLTPQKSRLFGESPDFFLPSIGERKLVGGLVHMNFIFPFSWECHHPKWWTHTGTGVAFAPEPCWVAFAPEWSGMKWVQGRMWPSFRGECDPCFCVAGAMVSEPQKDFFHPRESYSRVMRRSNSHFNQLPGRYGCYGVPLLRCNIHFEQLRRCFGCYVPTAISINFQHAMDATL